MEDLSDNDSLNSDDIAKNLAKEMENMEFDPENDSFDENRYNQSEYNPAFGQSHTSFKSMMSGATILTNNQRDLNKLVK